MFIDGYNHANSADSFLETNFSSEIQNDMLNTNRCTKMKVTTNVKKNCTKLKQTFFVKQLFLNKIQKLEIQIHCDPDFQTSPKSEISKYIARIKTCVIRNS